MNTRPKWPPYLISIMVLIALLLFASILLIIINRPAYSSIALAFMFFLLGLLALFAGIKQQKLLTRAESSSVWWKNYSIIMGIGQISFSLLMLSFSKFAKNYVNETVLYIIGVPVFIVVIGLYIYAIVVVIRYIGTYEKRM